MDAALEPWNNSFLRLKAIAAMGAGDLPSGGSTVIIERAGCRSPRLGSNTVKTPFTVEPLLMMPYLSENYRRRI